MSETTALGIAAVARALAQQRGPTKRIAEYKMASRRR